MSNATTPSDSPDPEDDIADWVYPSTEDGVTTDLAGHPVGQPHVRVTDRNLLFLKAYTESGNLVESMRLAGYTGTEETLRTNGYHLLRKLSLPMPGLLRAAGITIPSILDTINEAKSAHKITRVKVKEIVPLLGEDGQPVLDNKGQPRVTVQDVVREYVDIDHATRLHASQLSLRLYGLLGRNSPVEQGVPGQPAYDHAIKALIGIQAEEDAQAEEEQEKQTVSDRELRSDIAEIQRKLRLLGYELTPIPGAQPSMPSTKASEASAAPAAPVPVKTHLTPSAPDISSATNRTEKPKP